MTAQWIETCSELKQSLKGHYCNPFRSVLSPPEFTTLFLPCRSRWPEREGAFAVAPILHAPSSRRSPRVNWRLRRHLGRHHQWRAFGLPRGHQTGLLDLAGSGAFYRALDPRRFRVAEVVRKTGWLDPNVSLLGVSPLLPSTSHVGHSFLSPPFISAQSWKNPFSQTGGFDPVGKASRLLIGNNGETVRRICAQETCTFDGEPHVLSVKGRHDPCVLPRAPPLVEGMSLVTELGRLVAVFSSRCWVKSL